MPSGAPIGHEMIGEVINVGDKVRTVRPGDFVFVPAQISCGSCGPCLRGHTSRCASVPFGSPYGMGREGGYGGGLADLVLVSFADAMLTHPPGGADPISLIGAADMGSDAWRTVGDDLRAHPDAKVLVLGGMPPVIGRYSTAIAAAMQVPVTYVDPDPVRRKIAQNYGAQNRNRSFLSTDRRNI